MENKDKLKEFKPILNMLYVSAIIVNNKGNIEFINNLCENLFGYSCQEVYHKNIEIFIPDSFKIKHKEFVHDIKYESLRKHITGKDRIVKGQTKNKKIINIDIRFNPIEFCGETMNLLLCYDHTNDEKLLKTEQLLKETYNINKIGQWEYDIENNKLFLSKELHALINIPYNIEYNDSFEFIHKEDRLKVYEKITKCIENLESYNIICRLSEEDNKTKYIYIKGENNNENKIIGTIQDITENINLQKELKKKNDILAEISHEIRNPITGIIGVCSLLEENMSNDENVEYINIIKESINNLLTVVNNILEYSKSEYISKYKNSFNIRNTINKCYNIIKANLLIKNIGFIIDIDDNIPDTINLDEIKIQQILNNLLGNSLKFTNKGFIKVHVSLEFQDLTITIKDTGIGIPLSKQHKIFEKYIESDSGSGLGLSICKKLVGEMNGFIGFNSKENKGTTFWFTIPFKN